MERGGSEANVEEPDVEDFAGFVLDLATVNSILDKLVDNGALKRRIVDVGQGEQSYDRAP
jgi:beta-lactamase superfamily II metal-dependent hydrolase